MASYAYTDQITFDGTNKTPITTSIDCRKVFIRPDLAAVLGNYNLYAPLSTNNPYQLADGEGAEFNALMSYKNNHRGIIPAGTVVGYVKAGTVGTYTMYVKHEN